MKTLLLILTLLGASLGVQAQESIHNTNLKFVSDTYWSYLNRAPDKDGILFWVNDLDRGIKDKDELVYAFKVSQEHLKLTQWPTQCKQDYTKGRDYTQVLAIPHQELVVVSGKFAGRDLVGTGLDTLTSFLGNTLSMEREGCTYTFWFNYSELTLLGSQPLISKLSSTKSITVTYDPITGLATKVEMFF